MYRIPPHALIRLIVIALSQTLSLPAWPQATQTLPDASIDALVGMAKTKADHAHIADLLDHEARVEATKAQSLKDQAEAYREHKHGNYGKNISDLTEHTEALARNYADAAKRHHALAAIHRQIATELK